MLDSISIGKQIADKRRNAGLTQEELVEKVGEDKLSLSTLKRIESGQGHMNMVRIFNICKALDCKLDDLVGNYDLREALEKRAEENGDKDSIQDILYRQQVFYPKTNDSPYYAARPIKTLLQFLIYLPLMDDIKVLDVLRRIEGDVFGRESYVLDKLYYLYRKIPDSKAKRYADFAASQSTYDYYIDYYTSEMTDAEKLWLDPEKREEMLSYYVEYTDLIEKKIKLAEREIYR